MTNSTTGERTLRNSGTQSRNWSGNTIGSTRSEPGSQRISRRDGWNGTTSSGERLRRYPGSYLPLIRNESYTTTASEPGRNVMSEMEYGREADEVIGLAFETGYNSELRRQRVANFLRELVAASHSGCTGYGVPLASPESDAPGSGLLPRRGLPSVADWARLKRTLPEREPIKERLDDDWTEAGPPGSWQAGEPKTPRHWGVRS